ncbi:hypothetical protein ANTPLA_LOCUS2975 [Anthophora plagiata]
MPKFKAATTNRGKWNTIERKEAVMYVLDGKETVRCAAEKYNVPRSTLHDKIKALKSGKERIFKPKLGRHEEILLMTNFPMIYMIILKSWTTA